MAYSTRLLFIMFWISVIVLSALCTTVSSSWLQEVIENGWDVSNEISIHVDEIQNRSLSALERHSLRMNIAGVEISACKVPGENKIEVDVYYGDGVEESRGKKMGEMIVPIFVGLKVMTVGALMLAAVGSLALQSLATAKLSLLLSSALGISKLFEHSPKKEHGLQQSYLKYHELTPIVSYDAASSPALVPQMSNLGASMPSIGFNNYNDYPSPIHETAAARTQPHITDASISNEITQQVTNMQVQPAALQKRHYTKRVRTNDSSANRINAMYQ